MIARIPKLFKQLATAVRYVFMPYVCAACGALDKQASALCASCSALVEPVVTIDIPVTASLRVSVFALGKYTHPLKSVVMTKRGSSSAHFRLMGKALAASCPFQADVLVPVPLHWTRYAWRGFNQAEELAYGYAQNKKTRVVRAVKRIKRTKLQNNAQDRSTNVVGAFAATEVLENLKGKQILIVDDVLTSGATIAAVARIIMQAKPASIAAVVICRT